MAQWLNGFAIYQGDFAVKLVDLAEVALPLFDEPNHPIACRYTQPTTIAWSETTGRADAFVLVHPEYNHS